MDKKIKEILSENGWYEGRKIDATRWYSFYESGGVKVFDAFKKFFEEFGLLKIEYLTRFDTKNEALIIPTIYIPISLDNLVFEDEDETLEYQNIVGEKLLMLGIFDFGNRILYISKSGKFYDQYGFIAENTSDLWTCMFAEKFSQFIPYENLK